MKLFLCVRSDPKVKRLALGFVLTLGLLGCEPISHLDQESKVVSTSIPVKPGVTNNPALVFAETPAISLTATRTPTDSPSSTPTLTNSPTVMPTLTRTITPTVLPRRVILSPMNHQWQSLNNCHRASIAAIMGYYDVWLTQHDYDVAMDNLAEFLEPYGLTTRIYSIQFAITPMHAVVRWLLAENIPAIVGQRLSSDDNTWHYRVVYGYDDSAQVIYSDDSLLGPDLQHSYERFDQLSRTRGQVIPVYPLDKDELIETTMRKWQMKLVTYPK